MVGELMNQLRELHGDKVTIPEPYVTYFKDWTDDPFRLVTMPGKQATLLRM